MASKNHYMYDKGYAVGYAQGVAEARGEEPPAWVAKSIAEVLEEQLRLRFGTVSKETRLRLGSASIEQLDAWFDAVPSVRSLEAVFSSKVPGKH